PKTGVIQEPPDFHGFKNIHIVEILYKSFGIPVYLELGAHVGAMSELFYGNKKGYDNFLYISVDNWIGGCSVSNRTVYQGSNGLAGHMGGVVLERDAMDEKRCLSGCLQDYASITAITKWAQENGTDPNITWNRIVTEARHGESFARKVIERLVWYLGTAFINAVALLDIQCIYISGPILQGEDLIIPALEETVNRLMFAPEVRRVDVLAAKYSNNNAQIIGAAPLVLERRFEEEVTL
ncbi:MAG: ROK family protein, partial [Treponema sp.]|nr:ROK family protein [Treponema sp.]